MLHKRPHECQSVGLPRMDDSFPFAQSIDARSSERQRDRLHEELTLAQIDHHIESVDELDVRGILAFTGRILPRASDLWVQSSLDHKQRLQQLSFRKGSRSTEIDSIEPPQRHHFSTTWRGPRVLMKEW